MLLESTQPYNIYLIFKDYFVCREAQQAISNTEKPEEDDILFRQLQV